MRLIFFKDVRIAGRAGLVTETHDPVDRRQSFSMHGNTSQGRYATNQLQETVHRRR